MTKYVTNIQYPKGTVTENPASGVNDVGERPSITVNISQSI
jgi:hypothetical protein